MKLLIKDPRIQLSATLLLIFISSFFFYHALDYFKLLATAVGSAIVFDLIFLKLRKIEFFPPTAAITSGLIISIIFSPALPLYELILASFFAMFSKNFIKGANRHIFNPAGFGVLASSIIFQNQVSWWGASFQPLNSIYFLVLLSPLLISLIRLRRFPITVSFLIIYSLLVFLMSKTNSLLSLTDPTVLFFSLVMLPEPQTTPNKKQIQIFFGVFVAFMAIISSRLTSVDPLIFALLTGNFLFYKLK